MSKQSTTAAATQVDLDTDVDGLVEQYDQLVKAVKESGQPDHRVEDLDAIRRELENRVGHRQMAALLL